MGYSILYFGVKCKTHFLFDKSCYFYCNIVECKVSEFVICNIFKSMTTVNDTCSSSLRETLFMPTNEQINISPLTQTTQRAFSLKQCRVKLRVSWQGFQIWRRIGSTTKTMSENPYPFNMDSRSV